MFTAGQFVVAAGTVVVVTVAPVIVTVTVAVAETLPSCAVIVWVAAACAAVGVPEMIPVTVLRTRPAGSAGEMENSFTPPKSVSENDRVGVIAVPTDPVTVCVAGVMDGAVAPTARTVMLTRAVALDVPSLAVTV